MLLLLLRSAVRIVIREIAQEPDNKGAYQYDAAHLLEILTSLFPCVSEHRFSCRNPVWRKFHNERKVIFLEEKAHHLGGNDSQKNSQSIESKNHQRCILREKCSGNKHVDRHSSGTGHQWNDQHRDKTALSAFDGPCGHYRRHIAAESHYHRYERLAVQADLVHEPVHDECGTRHISGIFQKGYEHIEQENIR